MATKFSQNLSTYNSLYETVSKKSRTDDIYVGNFCHAYRDAPSPFSQHDPFTLPLFQHH